MIKKYLTLFLVLCFSFAFSQNSGQIKGKVIDAKTREPIPFVNIVLVGTNIGAFSNEIGDFLMTNIPFGYISVQASFLGYSTAFSEEYLVTNEKIPYIFIELTQNTETLDEVLVQSKLFKTSVESPLSKQSLGIAEIEKNPGGNRDVLKVIQSFPGVASNPGFRNDIIIRGNSPLGVLWRVNGLDIPNPNHFAVAGSAGGPQSIINNKYLSNSEFYTGAFPANYGNALGGVFDLKMRNGNNEKHERTFQLGILGTELALEGPISKKSGSSYLVSYRYSTLALFGSFNINF